MACDGSVWGLEPSSQLDVQSLNIHTPHEKRPLHSKTSILHARGTTQSLTLDVLRLYGAENVQKYRCPSWQDIRNDQASGGLVNFLA